MYRILFLDCKNILIFKSIHQFYKKSHHKVYYSFLWLIFFPLTQKIFIYPQLSRQKSIVTQRKFYLHYMSSYHNQRILNSRYGPPMPEGVLALRIRNLFQAHRDMNLGEELSSNKQNQYSQCLTAIFFLIRLAIIRYLNSYPVHLKDISSDSFVFFHHLGVAEKATFFLFPSPTTAAAEP